MTHPVSPMLRLFRDGAASYQPDLDDLAFETGDPQVSLDNLMRMTAAGMVIEDFMVRPTGVLVLFATGEQYYAPGFRVGTHGAATEALARIAAQAKFGPFERLLRSYENLPETYCGRLPDARPDPLIEEHFAAIRLPADRHPSSGFGPSRTSVREKG